MSYSKHIHAELIQQWIEDPESYEVYYRCGDYWVLIEELPCWNPELSYKLIKKCDSKVRSVGQLYMTENYETKFILAQITFKTVALISIKNGNRWVDPVEVVNPDNISEEEWDQITNYVVFVHIENN